MEFKTEMLKDALTRIIYLNNESAYLLVGTQRAALIDTGSGFKRLKPVVDALTDLPVTTLLTHGHTDHAMGAAEFEDVHMNPLDRDVFNVHGAAPFRWKSMEMSPSFSRLKQEDMIPTADSGAFHPLADGDLFQLGGQSVEILACPGHTLGSVCMLLLELSLLLLGDACNVLTFLFDDFSTGVASYRDSLYRLKDRTEGRYDGVLLSHTGGQPYADMVESNIAVCDDILCGRSDEQPFNFMGHKALIAKAFSFEHGRLDGGHANIVYSPQTKER